MKKENYLAALDIGTTKICLIIAEHNDEDGLDIIGYGHCPSYGLHKGVVVNIEKTVQSINTACAQAELMAGVKVSQVVVGIAGEHIQATNSKGVIAVSSRDKVISQGDINRVLDAARAVVIPMDRELIHVIPQEYAVNDQQGIKNPIGVSGVRLEVDVHLVTGSVCSIQNIVRSVNRAGLDVLDIVLEPIASAAAVVCDDEKEMGVCLIDIGGGTTDMIVYCDGSLKHTSVLALGGNHVTKDISLGLRTPLKAAEKIKIKHSNCFASSIPDKEIEVDVPSTGGRQARKITKAVLNEIVEPRMEEIFKLCSAELVRVGMVDRLSAGIVITGGASMISGAEELASQIIGMPIRIGRPSGVGGLKESIGSPKFATAVGLIIHADCNEQQQQDHAYRAKKESLFAWIFTRMRDMFTEAIA